MLTFSPRSYLTSHSLVSRSPCLDRRGGKKLRRWKKKTLVSQEKCTYTCKYCFDSLVVKQSITLIVKSIKYAFLKLCLKKYIARVRNLCRIKYFGSKETEYHENHIQFRFLERNVFFLTNKIQFARSIQLVAFVHVPSYICDIHISRDISPYVCNGQDEK